MPNPKLNLDKPSPGIYQGISFEDYLKIDAINNSVLKILTDQSPAHAKYYMENGRPETPSLTFGSAADCYILEPLLFAKKYVVGPNERRNTKVWKAFEADVPEGMEILKPADMEAIIDVYNIISKSHAMRLLTGGFSQAVLIWNDEVTGLLCKGRLDYLNENIPMITDLKTTRNAKPEMFAKDIFTYKYFQQAAFYTDGYKAITQTDYDVCFAFFAVEKVPPYVHSALELGGKSMEAGRMCYNSALQLYAKCKEEDFWPMYTEDIGVVDMPDWALKASGFGPHNLM